jgi:WD40 repeat protein
MKIPRRLAFLLTGIVAAATFETIVAQSEGRFPSPAFMLMDVKHKEPKSGVQLGPGNTITIQSGVGTPSTINVLSFSGNGKLLAAGKDFGRVVVWDIATRKVVCAVEGDQGIVHAVAISSDETFLAAAGEGDQFSLKLWHLPDCKLAETYRFFHGFIHTLAFGPRNTWLMVSDNTSTTYVLKTTTGERILQLNGSYDPILSANADMLMTTGESEFTFWRTSDWMKERTLPRIPRYAFPLALDTQRDIFVADSAGMFQLIRITTGEVLPSSPRLPLPKFNISAGGFAAVGSNRPLVFGHSDGRLWIWDTDSGRTCMSDVMYSESGAISPDGNVLVGGKDNSFLAQQKSPDGVWLWDTNDLVAKCGLTERGAR